MLQRVTYFIGKGICFEGKQTNIRHSNGMVYLDYLLHNPKKDTAALLLQGIVNKAPATNAQPHDPAFEEFGMLGHDAALDSESIRNIKSRIAHLQQTQSDAPLIEELQQYLRTNTYRGKSKTALIKDNEKARQTISHAIAAAIRQMKKFHPALADHMESHIIKGQTFQYNALSGIKWQ
jgi:hypothetical protein